MNSLLRTKFFLIFAFVCCPYIILFAQPGDPAGDPQVPITGIEILIGVGALLGARKLSRSRNKK